MLRHRRVLSVLMEDAAVKGSFDKILRCPHRCAVQFTKPTLVAQSKLQIARMKSTILLKSTFVFTYLSLL